MSKFFDCVLDAFLDTLKILPVLLIVYFLIEFLEYKRAFDYKHSKIMQGKKSPLIGAMLGCIPQCGFSVVSTELFSKGSISVGALVAIYISTSDEALPILISHINSIPALICVIVAKLVLGILIGYLAMFLYGKIFKNSERKSSVELENHREEDVNESHKDEHEEESVDGCCKHHIDTHKFEWKHPIIHSLKISAFILIVNLIFGLIIAYLGEDKLVSFLNSSSAFQPLIAVIVGLIPNCVASVVLTEMFVMGGLSFGALVAGLCVNAGIATMVLLKENKNIKENAFIFLVMIIPSLVAGYILHFIPFNFLLF